MKKLMIAVLISGRGSNLQALIDACAHNSFPARIVAVISNKPGVQGLERAERAGIPTRVIDHKTFEAREDFDEALDVALKEAKAQLICLAGFMRILDPHFVGRWRDRMINIHPSLLPSFKGLHTHERALEAGVRMTGCTVHFVRPEMDDGPIIIQAAVPVLPADTAETLADRILTQEHIIYPEAVRLIALGHVRVRGALVEIRDATFQNQCLVNPEPADE